VANGIYFAVGDCCVMAVDAYNGTELWLHMNDAPKSQRLGGSKS